MTKIAKHLYILLFRLYIINNLAITISASISADACGFLQYILFAQIIYIINSASIAKVVVFPIHSILLFQLFPRK